MMRCTVCGRRFTKTEVLNALMGEPTTLADFALEEHQPIKCLAEECHGVLEDLDPPVRNVRV